MNAVTQTAIPKQLFRYRPLAPECAEREFAALDAAFLWSPFFHQMNDPMEAFYELGGAGDALLRRLGAGDIVAGGHSLVRDGVGQFGLVSFSRSARHYPLWAYYASNFAGFCLEFDTAEIFIGDLQNEPLRPVTYATSPLGRLDLGEAISAGETAFTERFSRKRIEWAHEEEWRILTGQAGPRQYADHALKRVILGPRMNLSHRERICSILSRRPTEVVETHVNGYDLEFRVRQSASSYESCERVGRGSADQSEWFYQRDEIEPFLSASFDDLLCLVDETAKPPNCDLVDVFLPSARPELVCIRATYIMRNKRSVTVKRHYSRDLSPIATDAQDREG